MNGSRLETVRRVAELREAAARATVAAAQAARAQAEQDHAERVDALAGRRVSAAPAGAVRSQLDATARLADAAGAAARAVALREDDRRAAVQGWVEATRRARLLGEVCSRHREERATALELQTQQLLDDLAGSRTAREAS